jgi:hypothetical protein
MSFAALQQGTSRGRPTLYMGASPGTHGKGETSGSGFPFGSMQPTRVVNQTLGFQSNHTINYAYILRKFKSGFDQDIHQGQLVFIKKSSPPLGQRMYTVMNLPQLNFYLAKLQQQSSANGSEVTLATLHNMFAPLGIVQGDVGAETTGRAQERLVNVTISGRARTYNLFGNNCPDGTALYVRLEKMVYPNTLTTFHNRGPQLVPTNGEIYQYVPYANAEVPYPVEKDDTKVYYLGRVSHNSRSNSTEPSRVKQAHRSTERMATLPMMEVFVDYALTC